MDLHGRIDTVCCLGCGACSSRRTLRGELMVYSGYRFVEEAVAVRKPVAAVNRGRTRADPVLTFKVEAEVGAAIEALAAETAARGPATLARS